MSMVWGSEHAGHIGLMVGWFLILAVWIVSRRIQRTAYIPTVILFLFVSFHVTPGILLHHQGAGGLEGSHPCCVVQPADILTAQEDGDAVEREYVLPEVVWEIPPYQDILSFHNKSPPIVVG